MVISFGGRLVVRAGLAVALLTTNHASIAQPILAG